MFSLRDRKVCITGSSYGIGYEIVKELLARGAVVYSIARGPIPLSSGNLHHFQMDLSRGMPDIRHVDFDVLIMNVGYNPGQKEFDDLTYEEIERSIYLNVTVHLRFIKALVHKKIVFINSVTSMIGIPKYSLYCAGKSFISTLNESLAREGKDTYIIYPYKVNTTMFKEMRDFCTVDKRYLAQIVVSDIESGARSRVVPFIFGFLPLLRSMLPNFVVDFLLRLFVRALFR